MASRAIVSGALAMGLLLAAIPTHAQDFGRVFFSVEDRLLLNQMREDGGPPPPPPSGNQPKVEAPAVGEVTFNGRVQRSDGETTIWVNGRPVLPGNRTPEGIRAEATGRAGGETRFELPSGVGFELKVGQKIKVVTGKVVESYEVQAPEDAALGFTGPLPGITPFPPPGAPAPIPEASPGASLGTLPAPPGAARVPASPAPVIVRP